MRSASLLGLLAPPLRDLGLPSRITPVPPPPPPRVLSRSSGLLESQRPPDGGRFQGWACPAPSGLGGSGFWVNTFSCRGSGVGWGGPQGSQSMASALHNNSKLPPGQRRSRRPSWERSRSRPEKCLPVPGVGTAGDRGGGSSHQGGARRARQASGAAVWADFHQRSQMVGAFLSPGRRGLTVHSWDGALSQQ